MLIVCFFLFSPVAAEAVPFSFSNITGNDAGDAAIGEAQLWLDVTDNGGGEAWFTFHNDGPEDSSITQIYFDGDILAGLLSVDDSDPGVEYGTDSAAPPNLPGGNPAGFSADISIDPEAPVQPNGVNPGEYVAVLFSLQAGMDFSDLIDALNAEDLRVGIHVQGYDTGGSESFINTQGSTPAPVPEPATLFLLGSGLLGLGAYGRKQRS